MNKTPHYHLTIEDPKIDLNTLIHSVVHTYHPEVTEIIFVQYQDANQMNNSFGVNHTDLY